MATEESTGMYRRGFNDPIEGAKRYLELHVEIGELEAHDCPEVDFTPCTFCNDIRQRSHEQEQIATTWVRQWAQKFLRDQNTLPPQVWCECGHISGQHGVNYPHVCATGGNDGCENGCNGFKSKGEK